MEANDSEQHISDHLWPSYFDCPGQLASQPPPSKRLKTAHTLPVVCCDQPCPEESTLCFQDYCHDYCPDFHTESGQGHLQEPCQDVCTQVCHDPSSHGHQECNEECDDLCTDHCDVDCFDFCTDDCFDHCDHPATACMDECENWCTSHCLADCLECDASPPMSDVVTPQMLPYTFDHLVPTAACHLHNPPIATQAPSTPLFSTQNDGPVLDTSHVCRVKGCTAGCFRDEETLQDHIEKNHLVKINSRYVCQWEGCVKKVTKKSNEHIEKEKAAKLQGIAYVPPQEPFSDDHLHKLKRHYYVHSGKKAFECIYPGCGSVHATRAQLKVHMARHNPKEFICIDCDKVFTTQNQLKTHINAVHKKTKHFKCPDCDYACDDSSNMSSHKRKQHLFGVPCPGHQDFGCIYRDGRQSHMEKHMRTSHHHAYLLEDKDAMDAYWKREKRLADEERIQDEATKSESRRSSIHRYHHGYGHGHAHSHGHFSHTKAASRRRAPTSMSITPSTDLTTDDSRRSSDSLQTPHRPEIGLATLAQLMTGSELDHYGYHH